MYVAIERFADLMDGKRLYEAGDAYPRPGLNVTPERLAELAGSDNRMGRPVIAAAKAANAPAEAVNSPNQRPGAAAGTTDTAAAKPPRKPRSPRKRATGEVSADA